MTMLYNDPILKDLYSQLLLQTSYRISLWAEACPPSLGDVPDFYGPLQSRFNKIRLTLEKNTFLVYENYYTVKVCSRLIATW